LFRNKKTERFVFVQELAP